MLNLIFLSIFICKITPGFKIHVLTLKIFKEPLKDLPIAAVINRKWLEKLTCG